MANRVSVVLCSAAMIGAVAACSQVSDATGGKGTDTSKAALGDTCKDFPAPEFIYSPNRSCNYERSQGTAAHFASIRTDESMEKVAQWYHDAATSHGWTAERLQPLTQDARDATVAMVKSPARASAILRSGSSGTEIQVRLFPNAPY